MKMQKLVSTSFDTKTLDSDNRLVEFIASKEIADRDKEIVKIKGIDIKNYKKNPVILWSHDSQSLPIGKAVKITKKDDELKIKVQFATAEEYPFADTVYKLVKGGYLKATSIGFMPDFKEVLYNEEKQTRTFLKSELYEMSIVNVPANPGALSTGKSITKAFEDKVISEEELKLFKTDKDEDIIDKEVPNHIKEVKNSIKSLEDSYDKYINRLQAVEKRLDEIESKNEDSYYISELFKEYQQDSGTSEDDPDTDSNDDIYKSILDELKQEK